MSRRRRDEVARVSDMVVGLPPSAVRRAIVGSVEKRSDVFFNHISDGHVGFRTGRSFRSYVGLSAVIKAGQDGTRVRLSSRPVISSRLARRRAEATCGLVEGALRAAEHDGGGPPPA